MCSIESLLTRALEKERRQLQQDIFHTWKQLYTNPWTNSSPQISLKSKKKKRLQPTLPPKSRLPPTLPLNQSRLPPTLPLNQSILPPTLNIQQPAMYSTALIKQKTNSLQCTVQHWSNRRQTVIHIWLFPHSETNKNNIRKKCSNIYLTEPRQIADVLWLFVGEHCCFCLKFWSMQTNSK